MLARAHASPSVSFIRFDSTSGTASVAALSFLVASLGCCQSPIVCEGVGRKAMEAVASNGRALQAWNTLAVYWGTSYPCHGDRRE